MNVIYMNKGVRLNKTQGILLRNLILHFKFGIFTYMSYT